MSIAVDNPLDFPTLAKLPKDVKRDIAQAIRLVSLQVRVEERERAASILTTQCADHPGLTDVIALLLVGERA
jgi:hypothetical protein